MYKYTGSTSVLVQTAETIRCLTNVCVTLQFSWNIRNVLGVVTVNAH